MKKLLILSSLLLSLVGCGNKIIKGTELKEDTIYFSSVSMFYFSKGYAYNKTYDFNKKKIYTIQEIKDNQMILNPTSSMDRKLTLNLLVDDEEYAFELHYANYKEDKEGFFSLKDFELFV